jgi:hypothetical protein
MEVEELGPGPWGLKVDGLGRKGKGDGGSEGGSEGGRG